MNKQPHPPSLDKLMVVLDIAIKEEENIAEKIKQQKREDRILSVFATFLFLISLIVSCLAVFWVIWYFAT